ncbi:MAG TPA: pantoate--beta-alanine ligase [Cytophagales bacterium]|nr:pantoate--beta-alanine ligase [Cytophagales bacterium]
MDIIYDIPTVKSKLKFYKNQNLKIGLVPTMGALHKGHLALVEKSLEENDITCCSIYVNPAQFNNSSDLLKYPRPIENDIQLLSEIGCHVVFNPNDKEMYPFQPLIKFDFGHLENVMEGKFRPGHFNGVGIVVSKLFNIIQPDNAYFGQKDLQQFLIIRQLVKELSFDLKLNSVQIQRDPDGLAMSSRNVRLNTAQRKVAPKIYEGLELAKKLLLTGNSIALTQDEVKAFFNSYPEISLEYFEVVHGETLQSLTDFSDYIPVALCIAAFVGDVRLIDNLLLFS